jgi:hypothetical protein
MILSLVAHSHKSEEKTGQAGRDNEKQEQKRRRPPRPIALTCLCPIRALLSEFKLEHSH